MNEPSNKLTNLQLELLRIFKFNLAESQLIELKELLSKYFINKIDYEMDKVWNEKEWTDSTIDSLVNQHNRTVIPQFLQYYTDYIVSL